MLLRSRDAKKAPISAPKQEDSKVATKEEHFEFAGPHGTILVVLGLPIVVVGLFALCNQETCSVFALENVFKFYEHNDLLSWGAFAVYTGYLIYQLVLSVFAPGKTMKGTILADKTRLNYKLNGFSSLLVSCLSVIMLVRTFGFSPLLWVSDNCLQLAGSGIIVSLSVSLILYLLSFRSSDVILADGGNTGYPIYDFWMGRELNPRILWGMIDIKYVCELRPSLIGWAILNFCFAVRQYINLGYVTNSMMLVNVFQAYYVFDAVLIVYSALE